MIPHRHKNDCALNCLYKLNIPGKRTSSENYITRKIINFITKTAYEMNHKYVWNCILAFRMNLLLSLNRYLASISNFKEHNLQTRNKSTSSPRDKQTTANGTDWFTNRIEHRIEKKMEVCKIWVNGTRFAECLINLNEMSLVARQDKQS